MKSCRTISNLALAKNVLICLVLWSQKNAALQDLEIWTNIEKLESNQEPRLRTSDTCLMSVVPTGTVQGLIFNTPLGPNFLWSVGTPKFPIKG